VKKIIIAILFLFYLSSTANALDALNNSPTGFRNIKWGESVTKLGKCKLVEKSTTLMLYVKLDDKLKIGNIPLKKIIYVFCAGHFMGVTLEFSDQYQYEMKKVFIAKYGQPTMDKPYIDEYAWLDDNAMINLNNVRGTQLSRANISSVKEIERMDSIQQKSAEKAGNDF